MTSETADIGLVGLGLLGLAIARRLLDSGFAVIGIDSNRDRCDMFRSAGGAVVDQASEVFDRCDTVVLSLPDSTVVSDVLNQCHDSLLPGQTIIDTTTGDPDQMVAIADRLATASVCYIEANVAGSSAQVAAGGATLLLGGSVESIDSRRHVIDAISTRSFHIGEHGAASRFKLVHNLIIGLHRAVLAEGLSLAQTLGLDERRTLAILKETPAASRTMDTKGEKMVAGHYDPQARLLQHLKDVQLIIDQAQRYSASIPLSRLHCELLQQAASLGFGDLDNSVIRELYRQRSRDGEP